MVIKYIDIMAKDVYIEYSNGDFEYLSFTKTKNLIKREQPHELKYNCADVEKSLKFLNTILINYKIANNKGDTLLLK